MTRELAQRIRAVAERNRFSPGALGIITNPFYLARTGLSRAIGRLGSNVRGQVLDVGCGTKPYRDLFDAKCYVGMEVARALVTPGRKNADVFYDGLRFPFADSTFESVVCNQVLEHVREPELFIREISRVLRPGGHLLLSVPFAWEEHEQPDDYRRYSSFGLSEFMQGNGFTVVELIKSTKGLLAVIQLAKGLLYKRFIDAKAVPLKAGLCFLWSAMNLIGAAVRLLPVGQSDLYLDNIILAVKT
jgi:SAM-dependent methyltransferase